MATPDDDEAARERDDVRCEAALQTLEDVLWRFNESNEGTLAVYDILGFLVEDLVKEGFCAACVNETVSQALERTGVDLKRHREDDGMLRGPDDVFH
ncbi:MAG TPA: hypothetical protein VIS76_09215 [Pseudomonadales bacterium]